MQRHLFRKRKENQLMKFVSLPFALVGCVVVLEFLGSEAPIIGLKPEQVPQQVMETLNSTLENLASSRFVTFWTASPIQQCLEYLHWFRGGHILNRKKSTRHLYTLEAIPVIDGQRIPDVDVDRDKSLISNNLSKERRQNSSNGITQRNGCLWMPIGAQWKTPKSILLIEPTTTSRIRWIYQSECIWEFKVGIRQQWTAPAISAKGC